MSTRRTAQTENARCPPPRTTQEIGASWSGLGISVHLGASWSGLGITTGRDMSVVALSRDSPASRAPSPSHPTFATLSRPLPSRVRSLVEDLLGWPSQCHLHPFAVRSLPRVLYHTRGGGGSGISCASSTTPAEVGAPESPARALAAQPRTASSSVSPSAASPTHSIGTRSVSPCGAPPRSTGPCAR